MKIETFDLIQQRLAETHATAYQDRHPEATSPHALIDQTRRAEPLFGWDKELRRLLPFDNYNIQIPADAEWDRAMYTDTTAEVHLTDGARKLSAFVLRNKPFDMGSPLYTKLVVSETGHPDDSLHTGHPLLTVWAGPAGAYAAESPLLRDEANSTAWQDAINEVLLT